MNANATTDTSTSPRIYVASLSDYNNGLLHGVWIDVAGKDAEEIQEEVSAMLRGSKYPNVFVPCPVCSADEEAPVDSECPACNFTGKVGSAEEWAIHDYEGFEGIKLSEWESFETVAALAEMVDEHGEAFAAWYENMHSAGQEDAREMREAFEEQYAGEFASPEEWAAEFLTDTGFFDGVPENLVTYFNFEAWARDAQYGGDIWTHEAGYRRVFIFWNH